MVIFVEPNQRLQQLSQTLYMANEVTATHKALRRGLPGPQTHNTQTSDARINRHQCRSDADAPASDRKPERLGSGLRTGLDWTGLDSASANAVPSLASAVLFLKHGLYIILNDYSFARKSQHGRLSL